MLTLIKQYWNCYVPTLRSLVNIVIVRKMTSYTIIMILLNYNYAQLLFQLNLTYRKRTTTSGTIHVFLQSAHANHAIAELS